MDSKERGDLRDWADAYLADALDPFERAEFEELLHTDEEARNALVAAARRDLSLRRALNAIEPARKESGRRRRVRLTRSKSFPYPFLFAAAALIVFVAGLLLLSGTSEPPVRPREAPQARAPSPAPIPDEPPPKVPAPDAATPPPPAPPVQTRPAGAPPVREKPEEKPAPTPRSVARKPAPPPAAKPTVSKPGPATAALQRFTGRVVLVSDAGIRPVRAGQPIASGQGIRTGKSPSTARVRLSDGTRLEIAADSEIRIEPAAARIRLAKGGLTADVARQAEGTSLRFETPHGVAVVLGTRLRLAVNKTHTRLEVEEGRVRLERGGASGIVTAGRYGLVAARGPVVVRDDPPEIITVNFGAPGVPLPRGVLNDSGEVFDLSRGYGWLEPRKTTTQRTGAHRPDPGVDVLRATLMSVGVSDRTETWTMPLPNGKYIVTVCVGDPKYEQGPNHVWIEGRQLINNRITLPGRHLVIRNVPVEIRDGDLTMVVGGQQSAKLARDKTTDTTLNFLVVQKVSR